MCTEREGGEGSVCVVKLRNYFPLDPRHGSSSSSVSLATTLSLRIYSLVGKLDSNH